MLYRLAGIPRRFSHQAPSWQIT